MTDSEKIQILLDRMAIVEEAMKMLLVNDVLKDANSFSTESELSKMQKEYQQKIEELQKTLETQKNKIQTLQELADSRKRTIQTKDICIETLQQSVKAKDDSISRLQSQIKTLQQTIDTKDRTIQNLQKPSSTTSSYSKSSAKSSSTSSTFLGVGQKVKIRSGCDYCYESPYNLNKKRLPLYQPSGYVCKIQAINDNYHTNPPTKLYYLYTENSFGQKFWFWVDRDMIQPVSGN